MMSAAAAILPPGRHRINVAPLPVAGPLPPPLQLVAELFAAMLEEAGVILGADYRQGATPEKLPPLHRHLSPLPLLETVRDCLQYSNNFIANQLFLTCGVKRFGPPATWEKGRRCFIEFFSETLQLNTGDLQIAEGSGLSRANRISAVAMLHSLERFRPFADLLPKKGEVLRKSGTLSGVFCYAGYLPGPDARAFVILLNQPENRREEVLAALLAREAAK
jgi:D-alanyl-D-alanine carboxypeptidase/D-alanyl-D-alanine-endopeptidase (penicillin-binding protein 4)